MKVRPLAIPHAFEFTPTIQRDDRGVFLESYRFEAVEEAVGHRLDLRQANVSVSSTGVARGIHYAQVPPSQAKYVSVSRGAVIDFIVDLRVGSPAFGAWEAVRLDDVDRRAVYIAEGLGHAVMALTDDATLTYLCSTVFTPDRELTIALTDPDIGLEFPLKVREGLVSPKDIAAPSLESAKDGGVLPHWDDCVALYNELAAGTD